MSPLDVSVTQKSFPITSLKIGSKKTVLMVIARQATDETGIRMRNILRGLVVTTLARTDRRGEIPEGMKP
jgi:hypothetical protein